jgi:hypothetical protein
MKLTSRGHKKNTLEGKKNSCTTIGREREGLEC